MRVAVLGAGAVGSVVGGLLSRDHDVTVIARREHAEEVNAHGLRVCGDIEATYRPRASTTAEGMPEQDLVLITTKAYDTAEAVTQAAPLVGPRTLVASLQNGLGNGEVLARAFGERAVVGVPFLGATYLGPGRVRLAGLSTVTLGPASGGEGAAAVASVLNGSGVPTRAVADVRPTVWLKAVVNASINPITALVRRENGAILASADLLELSRAACLEATRAAGANGVSLETRDPFDKVLEVLRTTAYNRSSMLQDLERGKRTEIDEITGALVERGEGKGVPMPVNRALWALVRSLQC